MDTLIKTKLNRLTATEEQLLRFLIQLKRDSDMDELVWSGDSVEKLEKYESMKWDAPRPHPLYQIYTNERDDPERYYYRSEFFSGRDQLVRRTLDSIQSYRTHKMSCI